MLVNSMGRMNLVAAPFPSCFSVSKYCRLMVRASAVRATVLICTNPKGIRVESHRHICTWTWVRIGAMTGHQCPYCKAGLLPWPLTPRKVGEQTEYRCGNCGHTVAPDAEAFICSCDNCERKKR